MFEPTLSSLSYFRCFVFLDFLLKSDCSQTMDYIRKLGLSFERSQFFLSTAELCLWSGVPYTNNYQQNVVETATAVE